MDFILKYRREIIYAIGIILLYFFTRLTLLNSLPIFTDEAIYVRWSQIALHDPAWRFISLTDGKQPMFVWVAMVVMRFISDPLIAARFVSVAAGMFTMVGLWFLSLELFKNKKVALYTSLFYIFFPFAIVYDRMALYDSMVAAFYIWALYFSILLVRKRSLSIAYSLAIVVGGGLLTKTSNFFSIYLLPFLILLFNFKSKNMLSNSLRFVALAVFSSVLAYGLYNILRLSPFFHIVNDKNAVFVYPFNEWVQHPFAYFVGNLKGLISWFLQYLNVYLLLILVSLFKFKNYLREKGLLVVYFLLPFLALALFGKLIYPRFIFFMSVCLLPLVALGMDYIVDYLTSLKLKISKSWLTKLVFLIFIVYPAYVSFTFINDPVYARIADADSNQYVNSWASGWGVKESVNYFKEQAEKGDIYIATAGTFGLMPEALEIYLVQNPSITIKGYWPVDAIPQEVLNKAKKMPTFLLTYQEEQEKLVGNQNLELIFKVKQGRADSYLRVYKVLPR